MEEYIAAKRTIKCGKSCGDNGITPELLKYAGLNDIILGFINKAYSTKVLFREWKTLIIVPVPRSGDLITKPDNYRGISSVSLVLKLYNRMILNRLRPIVDPLLAPLCHCRTSMNAKANEVNVKTMDGTQLEVVHDFKYLESLAGLFESWLTLTKY